MLKAFFETTFHHTVASQRQQQEQLQLGSDASAKKILVKCSPHFANVAA